MHCPFSFPISIPTLHQHLAKQQKTGQFNPFSLISIAKTKTKMRSQVSQPQREALALQFHHLAASKGASLFHVRRMEHEARWGGCDIQILRKLHAPGAKSGTFVFANEFGEFLVPVVVKTAQETSGESGCKPQNERLYRIFLRQLKSPEIDRGV